MSQVNGDSFQRALNRFKQDLPQNLIQQFSISTLKDVQKTCKDIQDQQGQEGGLRNMRRLRGFLEAMDQFGQVIEVFLNVHEIVCFVWGPIKFLLVTTKTYVESFDKLLDVFSQIGEAIPGLQRYQAAFEKHPSLATVLEDYYSDILRFFHAAIAVFKRPKWKKLFHSTWKTFKSDFGPILDSLQKRRVLLESEKASATLYEIQDVRKRINSMRDEQHQEASRGNQEKHRKRIAQMRDKLQTPNYRLDQEISMEDRYESKSGEWIFQDPRFQAWSSQTTTEHSVLYVNGIPGAGKTTLISTVIDRLLEEKHRNSSTDCVAYFYFKGRQDDKLSHNSMLRAILDQLIRRDPSTSDYLFGTISDTDGNDLRSTNRLEKLVRTAMDTYSATFIVLDGLDECVPEEAIRSVRWFLSLIDEKAKAKNAIVRLLCCGQRDGNVSELFATRLSITLEEDGHFEDVREYCRIGCNKIRTKFGISSELEQEIFFRITESAKGMFLYARIVLGNLLSQIKRSGLRKEIEPGNFPQGLEKAYERVAVRVFDSTQPQGNEAKKVLGWITSAKRLLRWREIQALSCIDPSQGKIDYEGEALVLSGKELCGALVDVHCIAGCKPGRDDVVKIVHETAREFLIRKWLDYDDENAKLAIMCTSYLTSRQFARELPEAEVDKNILNGYYAFQDYAVQYWYDHCLETSTYPRNQQPWTYEKVLDSTRRFIMSYEISSSTERQRGVRELDHVVQELKELPENERDRSAKFNIENRTSQIRTRIELFQARTFDENLHDAFTNLHNTITPYKCPKPWCDHFRDGFPTVQDRNKHIDLHDLPFICPVDDCFASELGFDNRTKLDQHKQNHHSTDSGNELEFPRLKTGKTIHYAAQKGDLMLVKSFLDSGEDVNLPSQQRGLTPLAFAVKSGHYHVAELLCRRGARTSVSSLGLSKTVMHIAVEKGDVEMVHLLLRQRNCNPHLLDRNGRSVLQLACERGHLSVVKLIIEEGCVNIRTSEITKRCFFSACMSGSIPLVRYLAHKFPLSTVTESAFHRLVHIGQTAVAEMLYPEHVEVSRSTVSDQNAFAFTLGSTRKIGKTWFADLAQDGTKDLDVARVDKFDYDHYGPYKKHTEACFSADGKHITRYIRGVFDVITIPDGKTVFKSTDLSQEQLSQERSLVGSGCYIAVPHGGFEEQYIIIWDVEKRTIYRTIHHTKLSRDELISGIRLSQDGRILALNIRTTVTSPSTSTIRVWSVQNCTLLHDFRFAQEVENIIISPDGRVLAASSEGDRVRVWDLALHNSDVHVLGNYTINGNHMGSVAFLPRDSAFPVRFQATGSDSWEKLRVWSQGEELQKVLTYNPKFSPVDTKHLCQSNVSLSPDNRLMLETVESHFAVNIWNLETGWLEAKLYGHEPDHRITSIFWGPNSETFATIDEKGLIYVWQYSRSP